MPRRRTRQRRMVPSFLDGFPERLEQFKNASGLSWAELARCTGTSTLTVRRWRAGTNPNSQHLLALLDLACRSGLGNLLVSGCSSNGLETSELSTAGPEGDGSSSP